LSRKDHARAKARRCCAFVRGLKASAPSERIGRGVYRKSGGGIFRTGADGVCRREVDGFFRMIVEKHQMRRRLVWEGFISWREGEAVSWRYVYRDY